MKITQLLRQQAAAQPPRSAPDGSLSLTGGPGGPRGEGRVSDEGRAGTAVLGTAGSWLPRGRAVGPCLGAGRPWGRSISREDKVSSLGASSNSLRWDRRPGLYVGATLVCTCSKQRSLIWSQPGLNFGASVGGPFQRVSLSFPSVSMEG